MNNYPPGMKASELENPWAEAREQVREGLHLRYELRLIDDDTDEIICKEWSMSEEDFEGSVMRKADHALGRYIDNKVETKLEEAADGSEEK